MSVEPRLFVVTDGDEEGLVDPLSAAATARGLPCIVVQAAEVDLLDVPQLGHGDLLYRVGGSHRAIVVEQLLFGPGVATFYGTEDGPHRLVDTQPLFLARRGVPVPRAVYSLPPHETQLRAAVEALGGLPVILKRPGHSLGLGVMRLDTWVSLVSVVDAFRQECDAQFTLMANIEPAVHWRVVIVGGHAVCAYVNSRREGDFRTHIRAGETKREAPESVVNAAIQAARALGLGAGGVDVLEHESGQVYVLEVNFPFYFQDAMEAVGVNIADLLLGALLAQLD